MFLMNQQLARKWKLIDHSKEAKQGMYTAGEEQAMISAGRAKDRKLAETSVLKNAASAGDKTAQGLLSGLSAHFDSASVDDAAAWGVGNGLSAATLGQFGMGPAPQATK